MGSSLTTHRVTVTLAGKDEPLELVTRNPDLVRFDITRPKHGWPDPETAPMLWTTFIAWAAAKRTGVYEGTWEDWSNRDALDVELGGDVDVDPTQMGPGPSSP